MTHSYHFFKKYIQNLVISIQYAKDYFSQVFTFIMLSIQFIHINCDPDQKHLYTEGYYVIFNKLSDNKNTIPGKK